MTKLTDEEEKRIEQEAEELYPDGEPDQYTHVGRAGYSFAATVYLLRSKEEKESLLKRLSEIGKTKIKHGDIVRTKNDVYSETEYTYGDALNVGKETFTVVDIQYWHQGDGYLIFGDKSDKRNCQVWHQESELEVVTTALKRIGELEAENSFIAKSL